MSTDVLIVGGGAAGICVARRVRELSPSTSVTVVDSSPQQVYRPWLIYKPLGRVPDEMLTIPISEIAERSGFSFVQGTATTVDASARRVHVGAATLEYRCLLLALGAAADRDRIAGAREHALFPCEVADADELCRKLATDSVETMTFVISGERIGPGLEYAAWLARWSAEGRIRRLNVRVIDDGDVTAQRFGAKAARRITTLFSKWHAEVRTGTRVSAIEAKAVRFENGEALSSDVIAVVGPIRGPSTELTSGMTDARGFVIVDAYLRSSADPCIFAAGDAATLPGELWPKSWAFSLRLAEVAAANTVATLQNRPLSPLDPAVARKLRMLSLPDLGGRAFLIINKHPILLGRLSRRIRLAIDRKHFRTNSPGERRRYQLPW
jgi:NADH dehydrogenase FAD-containing subunit